MPPKYKTVAFDSASDLCRLYFSREMGKNSEDMEKTRSMNHYPGTTERLNMLIRRCKNFRDQGMEIVFLAHEQIEKIYGKKSDLNTEPVALKGLPDMPGNRTPEEVCRAADNVIRVRWQNGVPTWIGRREVLQGDAYWEVKTRFNANLIKNGFLPASYEELSKLAQADPNVNWMAPYIWVLYGVFGIGKTGSLETFPSPIRLFDLDKGSRRLMGVRKELSKRITELTTKSGKVFHITEYDVEHAPEYTEFMSDLEASV
jgi:hypothetical protein